MADSQAQRPGAPQSTIATRERVPGPQSTIISVALTGSAPTKAQNPALPVTEEEIAADAIRCWRAGAAIVHIHVRDENEVVTCDPTRYARVRDLIHEQAPDCDVIINMSTGGGAGRTTDDQRRAPVTLRPEIASFDAGSVNFGDRVFINSPQFLDDLAHDMRQYGVKPEIECFESGMIDNARRLIDAGLFQQPYWFQFVLGVRGAAPPTVKQLLHMVEQLPPGSLWSVCAIARAQLPMNVAALVMGGHARTGLEDNLYMSRGVKATNPLLVERLVRLARELGLEPATPPEARALLGLA
ncbi:MAG: 3-keto-5-aminohexanoate cleavage protein [Thermomicrobiales bacterium]